MTSKSEFHRECESLFGKTLGYRRRWKTSAAQALGIGRATLYRYFEDDSIVPEDVRAKLRRLAGDRRPALSTRDMLALFARGLVELQEMIDADGWIKSGYPPTLQRSFDLASARRVLDRDSAWPTDLGALTALAAKPLFEWKIDLSWDPEGDYTAALLIDDGEVTPACRDLAAPGRDPETELTENAGYRLLLDICQNRMDGQEVYATFRRSIIANPVLSSWTETLSTAPLLTTVESIGDIIAAFYQRAPEALAIDGALPLCRVSRTILRRQRNGFHTEHRDPKAIRLARKGDYDIIKWKPGTLQLRRAFRHYWALPGLTELELTDRLKDAGWDCQLWPKFDQVDLIAVSPDGERRIAVDVKDYLSPARLATNFTGFKSFSATHECFLVVPDYRSASASEYERRFHAIREARGATPATLTTASQLLRMLEIGQ